MDWKNSKFWDFAKRAAWIPIAYYATKGCFDSRCLEASTVDDKPRLEEMVDNYDVSLRDEPEIRFYE